MARPAGILFVALLALLFLLPAPCLAADQAAEPAPNSAAKAALDPDMDEGHRQFAHANYEEALEHYLNALERNKEDAYLYFRIGLTYYMLDDVDNSHVYWLKSYDIDPHVPDKFGSEVTAEGMLPILQPGDITIFDDQYYNYFDINYGDIIRYITPGKEKGLLGRRVVAIPGDVIIISGSRILVNGSIIAKDISKFEHHFKSYFDIDKRIVVPKDNYFVLGDNINRSYDSRHHGFINKNAIVGKPLVIFDSLEIGSDSSTRRDERLGLLIK